jgi:hypothetical protein
MISGAHIVLYSKDSEADRKFFRDVLKFSYVDAGSGWLIFALPPSELAVHPNKSSRKNEEMHSLFLMCDNLRTTEKTLRAKNVKCSTVDEQAWGKITMITLSSGGTLGLYEPKHPIPHSDQRIKKI